MPAADVHLSTQNFVKHNEADEAEDDYFQNLSFVASSSAPYLSITTDVHAAAPYLTVTADVHAAAPYLTVTADSEEEDDYS